MSADAEEKKIWKSCYVKLLSITIDKELNVDECVSQLSSTACRKLSALSRLSNYLCRLIKEEHSLKCFLNLCLNSFLLLGCFIVGIITKRYIDCMREL